MKKKDLTILFIDEIYSSPSEKKYETNKIIYNHIDEKWSIDLAEMIDYKISKNRGDRYSFVIIDNFSKFVWCVPLKNINSQTITFEFSIILTTSKRGPFIKESDRGAEFHNSNFQKFLKSRIIQRFSIFTEKGPSIAERIIRTIHILLTKQFFGW